MENHFVSGVLTIGSGLSAVASGVQIQTSISGNVIQVTGISTSVSGNVITALISGDSIQTSISGNVIQVQGISTSVSGNVIQTSISGNIIAGAISTSISGNIITSVTAPTPPPSTTFIFKETGFILPANLSGGVDLPDIGTFNSGLPIAFIGYSGMSTPVLLYGVSGYLFDGVQNASGLSPFQMFIGSVDFLPFSFGFQGGFHNLFPFTNTSQIKVITNVSGARLVYGGFV